MDNSRKEEKIMHIKALYNKHTQIQVCKYNYTIIVYTLLRDKTKGKKSFQALKLQIPDPKLYTTAEEKELWPGTKD